MGGWELNPLVVLLAAFAIFLPPVTAGPTGSWSSLLDRGLSHRVKTSGSFGSVECFECSNVIENQSIGTSFFVFEDKKIKHHQILFALFEEK